MNKLYQILMIGMQGILLLGSALLTVVALLEAINTMSFYLLCMAAMMGMLTLFFGETYDEAVDKLMRKEADDDVR